MQVTGSIKFDMNIDPALPERASQLRQQWDAMSRPIWIGASTHTGEDEILLAAHRLILAERPDALLILVPRHPERFRSVYELCGKQGFSTVRRSLAEPPKPETQVVLGDTMGELLFLFALADAAFVGGSLVPTGGHNLLEPAALGKPVLTGPHLFNFLDIAAQLRDAGALAEVSNAPELASAIELFWNDSERVEKARSAGLKVLKNNQGALGRLLEGLGALLK